MGIAKFEIRRKCMVCGEPFMAKTVESWYCSPRCSKIAYKRRRDEEIRHSKLDVIVRKIPKSQEYVKVSESVPFENVLNVAMLLCMNYVDAATTVSESCGGGGSTSSNWGKDDDEDERERARRCAQHANWLCKPIRKYKSPHR